MATITDNDLKMFQERARTEFSGCDVGGIAWDSVIWDLCNEVRRLRSVFKERGNAEKLREALVTLRANIHRSHENGCAVGPAYIGPAIVAEQLIDEALAAPARNCDVGTAEEQAERFDKFCACTACQKCNANRIGFMDCRFVWENMPYDEGGTDGSK